MLYSYYRSKTRHVNSANTKNNRYYLEKRGLRSKVSKFSLFILLYTV